MDTDTKNRSTNMDDMNNMNNFTQDSDMDEQLLRGFFEQQKSIMGSTSDIEDNGFSDRVMGHIYADARGRSRQRLVWINRIWVTLCTLAIIATIRATDAISLIWDMLKVAGTDLYQQKLSRLTLESLEWSLQDGRLWWFVGGMVMLFCWQGIAILNKE